MTSKQKKPEKMMTEVELELMKVVWSLGACTVKDVQNSLAEVRELAYTSVATMLKILEQKGFLKSEKTERAIIYTARVEKSEYEQTSLGHLKEQIFEGDPSSMVARMLDDSDLSREELEGLRALLNRRLKEK